jgi:hypothetical protein
VHHSDTASPDRIAKERAEERKRIEEKVGPRALS